MQNQAGFPAEVNGGAFDQLRAALLRPYVEEPYVKVLERARAEWYATHEAAHVWLDATIATGGFRAFAELTFWMWQALAAKERLRAVEARKRSSLGVSP